MTPRISAARLSRLVTQAFVCVLPLAAAPCENLKSLALKNVTITEARAMAAGEFRSLPAFCRVSATLRPSSDSDIKIEVWMPASGWNHSLQSVGNGAWAGTLSYPAMSTALTAGYATASTDTGHTGNKVDFVVGHPEKLVDFAYRAVHEMTVAAKAIVAANYGTAPEHSYWNGCSTGGRQALAEAQRYPGDYDGIIAGAPDAFATRVQGVQTWIGQQTHKNEAAYIPPEKYPLIHNAVLQACDAIDGVKDGVIEDPSRCRFDPGTLDLSPPQIELAKKIYA